MDESLTLLGECRAGTLTGRVWKISYFGADGKPLSVKYELELVGAPSAGGLFIDVFDLSDLSSVVGQALVCIKDHAQHAIQFNLGQLFTALRDAASSTQPT